MGDQQQSNKQEEWRVIPFATKYSISTTGRVLRNDTNRIRTPDIDKDGYHKYRLLVDGGKPRNFFSHRLVALSFLEEKPELDQVNHKNGIKDDNRLENLEWTTSSGNRQHAFDTGMQVPVFGESHGNAVLTSEIATKIGELIAKGEAVARVAEVLGVTRSQVSDVANGKCWLRDTKEHLPEIVTPVRFSDKVIHEVCEKFSEGWCRKDVQRNFDGIPYYIISLIYLKRTRLHVVSEYDW